MQFPVRWQILWQIFWRLEGVVRFKSREAFII